MSQVTGWPGTGLRLSKSVLIFTGLGDPNTSATQDVELAGVGSLFLQTDSATPLWVCVAAGTRDATSGNITNASWTNVTLP